MEMQTMIFLAVGAVVIVLYLMRRRKRLERELHDD